MQLKYCVSLLSLHSFAATPTKFIPAHCPLLKHARFVNYSIQRRPTLHHTTSQYPLRILLEAMASSFNPYLSQPSVNPTLPPIGSLMELRSYFPCHRCSYRFPDHNQLRAHEVHCTIAQPTQRTSRHDSINSNHSIASPMEWSDTRKAPASSCSSSAASESDPSEIMFTPNSSRASSVFQPHHGSRRTSRADVKAIRRQRRHSPESLLDDQGKKIKKTKKEQINRSNQAAVMYRMEDMLEQYCGWARNEQSGGNGNSAGLNGNKINVLRAQEAIALKVIHAARCLAIRSGTLASFEAEMQSAADAALEPDYRPGHDTFLELPPGEVPCSHEETKSKRCSAHDHPDWRECRKTRAAAIMRRNEDAYLASLGITRQQALWGSQLGSSQLRATAPTRRPSTLNNLASRTSSLHINGSAQQPSTSFRR
ncbi:hypothetical protein CB0940_04922 [Cercospora beticola]|uniref:Uncharacterized protein n=1 Tax=Cercospora beticola TaxID=122368 RepID=A0A2G5HMR4_CERBT|nr:hypothetical protein CB0940_04922 [Cercospora beticola]PIA93841.1 hypothetical protein CB0940_04922 [Cercospora beticola]WPB02207.1 hypothetical protein RHO25_006841 [Cercospora beticola]